MRGETERNKAPTLTPATSGSELLYYHSVRLCLDLFKSLFKGCVFPCLWVLRWLCRSRPAEGARTLASPWSDLQSYCIKRTAFIIALHSAPVYLLLAEHNPYSNSSALLLSTFKRFFRRDWFERGGSLYCSSVCVCVCLFAVDLGK